MSLFDITSFTLLMKNLIILSASLSIFFFIIVLGEMVHIIWNHYHLNTDWGKVNQRHINDKRRVFRWNGIWTIKWYRCHHLSLVVLISFLISFCLVLLFPLLHI